MESEDSSASSARDQFEKAEKLRVELAMEKFAFQISQREILGQERYVRLKGMTRHAFERRLGDHLRQGRTRHMP